MKIEVGSKWRNKRSGRVSEVARVTEDGVYFRVGKRGERYKYRSHILFDYVPVQTKAAKGE